MQLSDYRIGCVGTALKLYDQLGEEIYCEALRHIVEAVSYTHLDVYKRQVIGFSSSVSVAIFRLLTGVFT